MANKPPVDGPKAPPGRPVARPPPKGAFALPGLPSSEERPKEVKENHKPAANGVREGTLTLSLQLDGEWKKNFYANLSAGLLDIQKSKTMATDGMSISIKQSSVTTCSRGTGKLLLRVEPKEGSIWWIEFPDSSERDEWLNAFEAHGATVHETFKEGFMSVEVPGIVKKKKPRWFELRSDRMQYFKAETDTEMLESIALGPHTTVETEHDDKAGLTFSLAPNGDEGVKRTRLSTNTKAERLEWAQAVVDVVSKKDATVNPNSAREGYLFGGWKKNAMKKWFFILLPDKLQWFKALADAPNTPLGEVLLPAGAHVGGEDDGTLNVAPTGDEDEKLFYVNAPIPEECVSWFKSLSSIVSSKTFTKNAKSIKEGYMSGSKKQGTIGNRRYFVLLPDQIQYYTHRADEKPEGVVDLDGGAILEMEEAGAMKQYSALSQVPDHTSKPPPLPESGPPGLDKHNQEALAAKMFRAPEAKAQSKPAEKPKPEAKPVAVRKAKQSWTFGVAPSGDEGEKWYYITVDDERARLAWVTAINKLVCSKPFKVYPNSLSEGYAMCGTSKKGLKTRYIVLLQDKLLHFKSRKETVKEKPGAVELPSGAVCEMDNDEETVEHLFLVAPSGDEGAKPFFIAPNNSTERDMWISAIEELLASKEKKQNHESLREGYLYAGDKKVGHRKYFCILLKDKLQYFKARKDAKPAGEIPLPPGFHAEAEEVPGNKMLFVVAPTFDENEAMFYFCAKTADERRNWLSTLKALFATKPSQVVADSKLEGYLWVQLGMMKKLQKRYCVLLEDKLVYFKGRNDKKEGGFFPLPPGANQQLPADGEDLGEGQKFAFLLAPTGDEGEVANVLATDSEADRLNWMKAILAVLQTKNPQTNDKSLREGYMLVGKKKDGMRKRYCVLLEDKLEFFKGRNDSKAEDMVAMIGGSVLEDDEDENKRNEGFTVAQSGDEGETIYYLSCPNATSKKAWMEKIKILLQTKNSIKTAGSLREGYLHVGAKKGQHKRYCVLLQNSLLYYKSRQDAKEAGLVDLPSGAVVDTEEDAGPTEFFVASTGDANAKKLYCTARDAQLKDAWMGTIDELIQSKETKQHANSLREGYLLLSLKRDVPANAYKKRFAALFQDKIQFFVGRRDATPECEVMLPGGAHCAEESGENVFSVAPTGDASEKYFYLKAKTHADQGHWVKSLRELIDSKDSKTNPKSLMEGYLNGGFSKKTSSQQRYYFVLLDDRLEFYKSRNGSKAAGEVLLPGGFVVDAVEEEIGEVQGDVEPSQFLVAPSGDAKVKPFYCSGRDAQEVATWTTCLLNLQDTKVSKVNPYSIKEGYMRGAAKLTSSDALLYFILTNEQLEYFNSRNDKQASGSLPIPGGSVITYVETDEKPNTIEIATCEDDGATRYFMTGRDTREVKTWATAFAQVIDGKSPMRFASSIMEGYLSKKGFRKSSKRYVILSEKQLAYFVSKHDPKPKGVLDISPATKLEKGEKNDFIIETAGQPKLHFQCTDDSLFPTWYSAIEGAIAGKPKLFEGLLVDAMKRSKQKSDIPGVARQCITYIMTNGLETEGIFRVPGNNEIIQQLRKTFEAQTEDAPVELHDVHSAAGLFKLYWRMLAQPVVPFEFYDKLIALDDGLVAADQAKCEKIAAVLATLPPLNHHVLSEICLFLKAVSEKSAVNKMHSQNCAMVFAPSLIRQPEGKGASGTAGAAQAQKMVLEMEQAQRLIQTMIDGYDKIFGQAAEIVKVNAVAPPNRKLSCVALSPSIKNAPTRSAILDAISEAPSPEPEEKKE